jgi:hypothetical protein
LGRISGSIPGEKTIKLEHLRQGETAGSCAGRPFSQSEFREVRFGKVEDVQVGEWALRFGGVENKKE